MRTDRKSPRGNVSPHKVRSLMPSVSAASRAERRSFSLGGLAVVICMSQTPVSVSSSLAMHCVSLEVLEHGVQPSPDSRMLASLQWSGFVACSFTYTSYLIWKCKYRKLKTPCVEMKKPLFYRGFVRNNFLPKCELLTCSIHLHAIAKMIVAYLSSLWFFSGEDA